jgi:hypothetical protein
MLEFYAHDKKVYNRNTDLYELIFLQREGARVSCERPGGFMAGLKDE